MIWLILPIVPVIVQTETILNKLAFFTLFVFLYVCEASFLLTTFSHMTTLSFQGKLVKSKINVRKWTLPRKSLVLKFNWRYFNPIFKKETQTLLTKTVFIFTKRLLADSHQAPGTFKIKKRNPIYLCNFSSRFPVKKQITFEYFITTYPNRREPELD